MNDVLSDGAIVVLRLVVSAALGAMCMLAIAKARTGGRFVLALLGTSVLCGASAALAFREFMHLQAGGAAQEFSPSGIATWVALAAVAAMLTWSSYRKESGWMVLWLAVCILNTAMGALTAAGYLFS